MKATIKKYAKISARIIEKYGHRIKKMIKKHAKRFARRIGIRVVGLGTSLIGWGSKPDWE